MLFAKHIAFDESEQLIGKRLGQTYGHAFMALTPPIVLQQGRQTLVDELNSLAKREAKLELRAPISGVVGDAIVAPQGAVVAGLVNERDQARLHIGQQAVFISEDGAEPAIEATLSEIGAPGSEGIESGYLLSLHGGAVAMVQEGGRPVPVFGVLPVRFTADMPAPLRAERGTLTVSAESTSFLALGFGRFVSVFCVKVVSSCATL